jgi:hypothetical protein
LLTFNFDGQLWRRSAVSSRLAADIGLPSSPNHPQPIVREGSVRKVGVDQSAGGELKAYSV